MLWVFVLGGGYNRFGVNVECKLYFQLICMFVAHSYKTNTETVYSANTKVVYSCSMQNRILQGYFLHECGCGDETQMCPSNAASNFPIFHPTSWPHIPIERQDQDWR